jgi:hypothetical protein
VAPDGALALAQGSDVIITAGETLKLLARVKGGAADFWYPFRWTGFRPRDAKLDQPVEFAGPPVDSTRFADSVAFSHDSTGAPVVLPPPVAAPPRDTVPRHSRSFTVSFAAFPVAEPARELAAKIRVGSENARVATAMNAGTTIYRVILGPYATRDDADRVGRESRQSFWVYESGP